MSDTCHRCNASATHEDSRGRPLCKYCDPLSVHFSTRSLEDPKPEPSKQVGFLVEAVALLHAADVVRWVRECDGGAAVNWEQRLMKLLEKYG